MPIPKLGGNYGDYCKENGNSVRCGSICAAVL